METNRKQNFYTELYGWESSSRTQRRDYHKLRDIDYTARKGEIAPILNTEKLTTAKFLKDRLCGLVVRVLGYTTEMYCASCEIRTEFIYVM
jgi:hypothetical protein